MSPTFLALRVRNFRLFVAGQLVSNAGTWMQRVAQDWLVLQLTGGSGTALGVVTGLQFLPMLLFTLWGGVLADRFPKRRLLVLSQAAMGVQALLLGLLVISGLAEVWHVYLLAFLLGTAAALDTPVRQSFVVEMVGTDDLPNAVALNSATFNLGRMVGPALAGLLIAAVGTGPIFLVNAASFAAVIGCLLLMRPAELRPAARAARGRGALRAGVAYVRRHRELTLVMVVVFVVGTIGFNFQVTMALMGTAVFGVDAREFGLLGTAFAAGALAGALLAARRSGRTGRRPGLRLVLALAVAFGALEAVAGLAPSYAAFVVLLVPTGLLAIWFATSANAYLQLGADPGVRGRVMAIYTLVFFGGTPFGSPVIGWLGETVGPRWTLVGSGAAVVVLVTLAVLVLGRDLPRVPGEPSGVRQAVTA
ncbi:MAG: MFS transporter [Actinomycetia bacterium]|nr:MFS transporter [Actinomycetes bacterium]